MKTLEQYFVDWETHIFGYGYGTGEAHVFRALKTFFDAIPDTGRYDYTVLEKAVTPSVTWLLINILIRDEKIEYGTSPRYGWLTKDGKALADFVKAHSIVELNNIIFNDSRMFNCEPKLCQCDDGTNCTYDNPFYHVSIT